MQPGLFDAVHAAADFQRWERRFADIDGFLSDVEGYALLRMAALGGGCGAIVEVGSYLGRSTAFLAAGSASAGRERVVAVDHFAGSPEHQAGEFHASEVLQRDGTTLNQFRSNLESVELIDHVDVRVGASTDVAREWSEPIRLLFVDGDHSYESSRADFEAWSPHIVERGLVCFHDIPGWPGVTRFYEELVAGETPFVEVATVDSMKVLERLPETR